MIIVFVIPLFSLCITTPFRRLLFFRFPLQSPLPLFLHNNYSLFPRVTQTNRCGHFFHSFSREYYHPWVALLSIAFAGSKVCLLKTSNRLWNLSIRVPERPFRSVKHPDSSQNTVWIEWLRFQINDDHCPVR